MLDLNRRTVLAYRFAALGLLRDRPIQSDSLARARARSRTLLNLGGQDTPPGAARVSFAVRGAEAPEAVAWTIRGAPHFVRSEDLPHFAQAPWLFSDDGAIVRLSGSSANLRKAGVPGRKALTYTASAWRNAVTKPMTKREASAAVTRACRIRSTSGTAQARREPDGEGARA